jgi:arginase
MRRIAILDAPSNLGLRPPTATSVPGCAKAPGALRDHGLVDRLHARDAGCLTPPRYDPGDWRPGDGVSHAAEIATYSRRLADRIGAILDAGEFPVILGGDCSIVLGSGLAMHRLGEAVGGRIGLVFVDGHSDFRHPGNASYVGAAAGEDLALVTGRGQPDLAAIEGRRPYFRDVDVVVMGIRAQDEYRLDLQAAGIVTRPVPTLRVEGAARSAQWAREQLTDCVGYWVHVDMDVLDPAVMPAVDAPEPGGIAFPELELLLAGLVDTPDCLGVEITVFDPDYDPDGAYAQEITSTIVAGLAPARTAARPDLIQARAESAEEEPDAFAKLRAAESDAFAKRRAAAAADSVSLAAAGMSGLAPEVPEDTAAPATTLMGVEDADEVEARPVDDPTESDSAEGDPSASAEATGDAGRPLGSAPLLDSEPLPATRPGMLRPRPSEVPRASEGFSLPAQRPAFDAGPGEPADIA